MTPDDGLLTTREAAALLRCSRQHVADLCDHGALPYVRIGTHRRLHRRDVLAFAQPHLRREQEQSWWLHHAVAGRLVADPDAVLSTARANLAHLRQIHASGRSDIWLDHWQHALDQGPAAVLDILTSRAPLATELRQSTPFSGVLTPAERLAVLAAFRASRHADDPVAA